MKFITVLFLMSFSLTVSSQALPTAKTTKSSARAALAATPANVSISTGQAYSDCGGCPIPNDTAMLCMACAEPVGPPSF
jgi:hypothetical protein